MDNSLTCNICLDRYKNPATLPCGHNFCMDCISKHWDEREKCEPQDVAFNCPVCKETFVPRPSLNRNVCLAFLSEAERDAGMSCSSDVAQGGPEQQCAQHQRPLIFYCRTERVCVCSECSVNECKEHDKVLVEEERSNREEGLKEKGMKIKRCKEEAEQNIQTLTENISKAKVSLQQTSLFVDNKFSQLLRVLMEKQEMIKNFVEQQRTSTLAQAEARLHDLQENVQRLEALEDQISSLCALPHCQFIQDTRLVEVPQIRQVPLDVSVNVQDKLAPVTDVLSRIAKLVCEDLDKTVYASVIHNKEGSPQDKRPMLAVVPSPATPSSSYPAVKEGLNQYGRSLTFDPCTAYAHLQLSQNNQRAEHLISGPHSVLEHQDRFDYTWQVLCSENFTQGIHYWEMEVSKPWAYVGVTYPDIPRKETGKTVKLGMNNLSWSLQLDERQFTAWHAAKSERVSGQVQPHTQSLRIGILLDYEGGTLTFYGENQVRLHAFHCVFTRELYPACWIGEGVTVTLCPP
ncbi:E3 ubiquitin-protein ligase TRIM65 [Trichomycterus rosablanca]|uniref:E3 ubiquitin-protein ligase TRIM65 n=1 Tax=Trichomycterus rosablanca TaxID=2290929 RepID=UPI002F35D5FD